MSNTTIKKEGIFNIYAENIQLCYKKRGIIPQIDVDGQINNDKFYICPICNGAYFKKDLDDQLTLEHVPPKKLNGKPKVLTCKKCNNTSGEDLDVQLIEYINLLYNGINGGTKSIRINDQYKTSGNIKFTKKEKPNLKIYIHPNSPLHKNFERVKNVWKGSSVIAEYKLPNPNTIQLSLLRIAYLMMFEKLGIGFICTKAAQNIREIIYKKEFNRIKPFELKLNFENNELKNGIYFMDLSDKIRGYLVVIEFHGKNTPKTNFYIPIPGHDEYLEDYLKLILERSGQNITISRLPEIDYLSNPENLFFYQEYFDKKLNNTMIV